MSQQLFSCSPGLLTQPRFLPGKQSDQTLNLLSFQTSWEPRCLQSSAMLGPQMLSCSGFHFINRIVMFLSNIYKIKILWLACCCFFFFSPCGISFSFTEHLNKITSECPCGSFQFMSLLEVAFLERACPGGSSSRGGGLITLHWWSWLPSSFPPQCSGLWSHHLVLCLPRSPHYLRNRKSRCWH